MQRNPRQEYIICATNTGKLQGKYCHARFVGPEHKVDAGSDDTITLSTTKMAPAVRIKHSMQNGAEGAGEMKTMAPQALDCPVEQRPVRSGDWPARLSRQVVFGAVQPGLSECTDVPQSRPICSPAPTPLVSPVVKPLVCTARVPRVRRTRPLNSVQPWPVQ
eukprot:gene9301-biopygen13756